MSQQDKLKTILCLRGSQTNKIHVYICFNSVFHLRDYIYSQQYYSHKLKKKKKLLFSHLLSYF